MKKYLALVIIRLLLSEGCAQANWTYIDDYIEPYKVDGNILTFTCTNAVAKVEVCTEDGAVHLLDFCMVAKYWLEPSTAGC